ncbi:unnamed protein product [Periconia digitata]|uniref:Carboxylic ester hydrolase n=1 Tax=Periconia digitata TaxID=1303443 RepID=A0A9W4U9S7_9PLEO|nr:unnamed protein product [Periconia digitata]
MAGSSLTFILHLFAFISGVHGKVSLKTPEEQIALCKPQTFKHLDTSLGVNVLSTEATPQTNYNTTSPASFINAFEGLDFCRVEIVYNPPNSAHEVRVEIWLPLTAHAWSGRYQATGGASFKTGLGSLYFGQAIHDGYVVSSTDGGNRGKDFFDLSWALKADKTIDWDLLHIAFTSSVAEQIIISRSVVAKYYGESPRYSYWQGCGQAGRQGYMLAQQYPHLLDGILANAPEIHFTDLTMGEFWPQLVMKEEGIWMSECQFNFFRHKALEACDMLDGVSDGIIYDPSICDFDPLHVVGKTYYCDGEESEVTMAMANIVRRIEEGPRTSMNTPIWYGFRPTISMDYVAATERHSSGTLTSKPSNQASSFIKHFLLKDPTANLTKLTNTDFFSLWTQAKTTFSWLWDSFNPDLHALKAANTKLLTFHGMEDAMNPWENIARYREHVERVMGGANTVDEYYRLFLAPGVGHCHGWWGPEPVDPLAVLVDWVEKGEKPETMEASMVNTDGELVTRDLCAWPGKAKYMGLGDAKRASSWSCEGGTERGEDHAFENQEQLAFGDSPAGRILGGLKERFEGMNLGLRIG